MRGLAVDGSHIAISGSFRWAMTLGGVSFAPPADQPYDNKYHAYVVRFDTSLSADSAVGTSCLVTYNADINPHQNSDGPGVTFDASGKLVWALGFNGVSSAAEASATVCSIGTHALAPVGMSPAPSNGYAVAVLNSQSGGLVVDKSAFIVHVSGSSSLNFGFFGFDAVSGNMVIGGRSTKAAYFGSNGLSLNFADTQKPKAWLAGFDPDTLTAVYAYGLQAEPGQSCNDGHASCQVEQAAMGMGPSAGAMAVGYIGESITVLQTHGEAHTYQFSSGNYWYSYSYDGDSSTFAPPEDWFKVTSKGTAVLKVAYSGPPSTPPEPPEPPAPPPPPPPATLNIMPGGTVNIWPNSELNLAPLNRPA